MKKILLVLLTFFTFYNVNAQKIVYDGIQYHNVRVIKGKEIKSKCSFNNYKCFFEIIGYRNLNPKNEIKYVIGSHFNNVEINEDCTIEFKTFNNNIMINSFLVKDNVAYFYLEEKDFYKMHSGIYQINLYTNNNLYYYNFDKTYRNFGEKMYSTYDVINRKHYANRY